MDGCGRRKVKEGGELVENIIWEGSESVSAKIMNGNESVMMNGMECGWKGIRG